jgi:hypothetical protein
MLASTVSFITASSGSATMQFAHVVVSYQTKRTKASNDANHTLQEAGDEISAELTAKGYLTP